MDQQKDVFSPDTSGGTPGTNTARRVTSAPVRSSSQRQVPRVSPGKRAGTMSSPTLDYARRMNIEAQAYRTAVRVAELDAQARGRNDAVVGDSQNEMIEGDFDLVPGTAARRNVTIRRSRDRLSARPVIDPRTPEDLMQRRSVRRSIDVEYSNEQLESRSASAKFHVKKHGEELKGPYRVIPYSQYDPEEGWRNAGISDRSTPNMGVAQPKSKSVTKEERKFTPSLWPPEQAEFQFEDVSGSHSFIPQPAGRGESDSGGLNPDRPLENNESSSDSTDEDLPLFLRKDIPSEEEDLVIHGVLTELWSKRQRTSLDLVQALNEDDSDRFEKVETEMRQLNQQMHQVLKSRNTDDEGKYVNVDDLPLFGSLCEEVPLADPRPGIQFPPSALKQSAKSVDRGGFNIRLRYQGSQIMRRVHSQTRTRVVYHMGQQFLREAFALPVASLSSLLLIHNHELMPVDGQLGDIPITDGAEISIIYVPQPFVIQGRNGKLSGSPPDHGLDLLGDYNSTADRMAEERHDGGRETRIDPAYRVPSSTNVNNSLPDPVHDGLSRHLNLNAHFMRREIEDGQHGADDSQRNLPTIGDQAGHRREEGHSFINAWVPSQPGTNGGASFAENQYAGNHKEGINDSRWAHATGQAGNNDRGFQLGRLGEYHRGDEIRMPYDVRTPQPIFSHGAPDYAVSDDHRGDQLDARPISSGSYDKIRQAFKCPRFSGQSREWKQWNKGFMRYLSIWELDYVLDPSFFDGPQTVTKKRDNKMVYYIIEDAVQNSSIATAYVKQAPLNNGAEAYYTLHDGFVFAGSTTATLLLNELSNFRFLPNETPTALCFRLGELFEELSLLPGNAAVVFSDTQKIGYLLNALRHEEEWSVVSSSITSAQIKGDVTFREACSELKIRCETTRAHALMDRPVNGKKAIKGLVTQTEASSGIDDAAAQISEKVFGLISTMAKRQNLPDKGSGPEGDKANKKKYIKQECLVEGCSEMTTFPMCGLHYHSMISGKTATVTLRNGYGDATYDGTNNLIVYPIRTPKERLPSNTVKKVKAGLANPD